jgi:hypothetical protein
MAQNGLVPTDGVDWPDSDAYGYITHGGSIAEERESGLPRQINTEVTGVLIRSTGISRRGLFAAIAGAAAAGSAPRLFAASDFWNKKDPQDWTRDEIDRLTSNSPWAKPVSAQVEPDRNGTGYDPNNPNSQGGGNGPYGNGPYGGQPRIGLGIPGIGIPGIGYPGGGRRGQGRPGSYQAKGTVLWESAEPVTAALKPEFPEEFADHHVIALSGFPFPPPNYNSEEDALDDLKTLTYLTPERGSSAQPGLVKRPVSSSVNGSILFGFSKDLVKVSADDKILQFRTRLGRSPIEAKFVPKEMLYRGKLAV